MSDPGDQMGPSAFLPDGAARSRKPSLIVWVNVSGVGGSGTAGPDGDDS